MENAKGFLKPSFILKDQKCPVCARNSFDTIQLLYEIPEFGKSMFFVMKCNSCLYKKNDVMILEEKEPSSYSIEVNGLDDMNIRIIKSSASKVRIPGMIELESGSVSEGYISNVEGVLVRLHDTLQFAAKSELTRKQSDRIAKHIGKLEKVMKGDASLKLIIEDPTGNSAIVSEKATKKRL
ncbi:MAG: ZPR1 zinc finger domain-containing protein [Candidatus Woesearchaeota archaeon]